MIIESILNLLSLVITTVFGILPNVPSLEGVTSSIDTVLNTIFNNVSLIGCFVRPGTIQIIVPLFLIVYIIDST